MKKSIAWLLYLGIGLSSLCLNTTLANTVYRDTVIINAGANLKVFIIGNELGDVLKYHRADSIKTLFMNDLQRALEKEQHVDGRENHYLCTPLASVGSRWRVKIFKNLDFNWHGKPATSI